MWNALNFIYQDKEYSNDSVYNSINGENRFLKLYEEGVKKMREKGDNIELIQLEKLKNELIQCKEKPFVSKISKSLVSERHVIDDFYEYNQSWLKNKENRLQNIRTQRAYEENEKINEGKDRLISSNVAINLPYNYSGPISGWYKRVNSYIKKRNHEAKPNEIDPENCRFTPYITDNSRKIATRDPEEKIENRLLRQGEETRNKKEDIKKKEEIKEQMELEAARIANPKIVPEESGKRLFENAEKQKNKLETLRNDTYMDLCFQPKLNRITGELLEKVKEKRRPLHEKKKNYEKEEKEKQDAEKKKQRNLSPFELKNFIDRNYEFPKKQKTILDEKRKEKLKEEMNSCPFAPTITDPTPILPEDVRDKNLFDRQKFYKERADLNLQKIKEKIAEKDCDAVECTFKPAINKSKKYGQNHSPLIKRICSDRPKETVKLKKEAKKNPDHSLEKEKKNDQKKTIKPSEKTPNRTPVQIRSKPRSKEEQNSSEHSREKGASRLHSKSPSNNSTDSKKNDSFNIVTGGMNKDNFNLDKILNDSSSLNQDSRGGMNLSTKDSFNESLREKGRGSARGSKFLNTVQEFGALEDEIQNVIDSNKAGKKPEQPLYGQAKNNGSNNKNLDFLATVQLAKKAAEYDDEANGKTIKKFSDIRNNEEDEEEESM